MVLEATLTNRQLCKKLQCLYMYENLMLNNFCKMAVLKKIRIASLLTIMYSTEKIRGHYMQLHVLEPVFKILYLFVCKNFSSCPLKFPWKNCTQTYRKSKASVVSVWRNLSSGMAPKIC